MLNFYMHMNISLISSSVSAEVQFFLGRISARYFIVVDFNFVLLCDTVKW